MGRERQIEREMLSFNNSWWSSVIRTGSITTLSLEDASSWSVLQESNRSGWLINTHLGGWSGETTTEQWTIKCTLIPFVRLSSCFCAALTYFSVCLSLCLSVSQCKLSVLLPVLLVLLTKQALIKSFVKRYHLYICVWFLLSLPCCPSSSLFFSPRYIFLFSLLSTAGSQWAAPTSHLLLAQLLLDIHSHPHSRWCTIYSMFWWDY